MNENLRNKTFELIDALKATTTSFGLGNGGNEYKIIVQILLYKYFNDKFAYACKNTKSPFQARFKNASKWDAEYDKFTPAEIKKLFLFLGTNPKLRPEHTLAHIFNQSQNADFSTILDRTLSEIAELNANIYSVKTAGGSKIPLFGPVTQLIADKRDDFARALISKITSFSFEEAFGEKYDFFSQVFEHLVKDYNTNSGGKYAEYYTPRWIAQVIARLLVPAGTRTQSVTCYDPSAGTGTLLMALAHQIGEENCSIYSQDISEKSSEMLRLNLVLNNLAHSLPNIVQGNTLTEPAHKNADDSLKQFDFIVSNPPFNLDFSDYRFRLANDQQRFWAGVPKIPAKKKESMSIYTCFIQHVVNSLKSTGKGAIVVPTGFITAKSGVENKVLRKLVDDKIVSGVISMPSNVFATTGTNVSLLFFNRAGTQDKVVLIDASKLGEEYKEGKNKKKRVRDFEIDQIVNTFLNQQAIDEFSVVVSYDEIKEKNYSLSAGQYFDIKIEHIEISPEEFQEKMRSRQENLKKLFVESRELEKQILENFGKLRIEN